MIEWILVAALGLFGWFQTDRLSDEKKESEKWREIAASNYNEWEEAVEANGNLKDNLDDFESSLNECTDDIKSVVAEINTWEEASRKQTQEINRLKSDLENMDYSDSCRLPDNLDIETYRTTEG